MTRRERLATAAAGLIVLGLLAAACSGVGVQQATNPYEVVCSDERAYLDAVRAGDPAKVNDAIMKMQTDLALIPDRQPRLLLQRAVDSASKGNPELIEQDYLANCALLPSSTTTSNDVSPATQT